MDNEIRIHYVSHFLKLSLWYARFLMGREGIAFENAITSRVNVYQPKSPLSEMRDAFMGTLLQLLKDTQQRRSDVKTVRCGSWLNSAPPFQDLFPKSWRESAIVSPKAGYTMGHWGQFMDRTGRFHIKNGAHLRATGEFLYPCSTCYAPIDEIVAHLEAMVRG